MSMHDFKTKTNSITPMIVDERKDNIAMIDVFSKLMSNRIIYLGTPIDSFIANIMNAQLLYLDHQNPKEPITIYINSPGGEVYAGLGIYDTMKFIESPIYTVNTGLAASMASIILCAGNKGERKALKHSRTLLHQPLSGTGVAQASDIEIVSNEVLKLKKELYNILVEETSQTYQKIEKDADRDFWLTAQEALDYGLIDKVLDRHPSKMIKQIKKKATKSK